MSVMKRRKMMLVAVIAASAVFIASALVAGAGLSGYERLKNAGFQFIEEYEKDGGAYSNGMFWTDVTVYIDDEIIIRHKTALLRDGEREFTQETEYQGSKSSPATIVSSFDNNTISYTDNDVIYRWYGDDTFYERENTWKWYYGNTDSYEDERITPAQRQLIEAVADALIGDTRNYFVSEGNVVSIALSGNQIPQIAQYAVAAFAERTERAVLYAGGAESMFGFSADARFSNGSLEVELDDNNNVTGAHLSVEVVSTVDGRLQTLRITAEFLSRNIGATTIQKPDGNAYGKPILPSYEDGDASGVTYAYDAAVA